MPNPHDVRVSGVRLHFLPIETRVPLKFGSETLTSVTCARARVEVVDRAGRKAAGWGETPLSVQWVWPSTVPHARRHELLKEFCMRVGRAWLASGLEGHALESGWDFVEGPLRSELAAINQGPAMSAGEPMPWLAALLCAAVYDQALHDAYGRLVGRPIYATYGPEFMRRDLGSFLVGSGPEPPSFGGRWPSEYLQPTPSPTLAAWHLVGGLDPVERADLTGSEPADGYPVLLEDWIRRDGLHSLKVKLRGNDLAWDAARLARVGEVGVQNGVEAFSADFNCTVRDPAYVLEVLDRTERDHPELWRRLLYVEQPFPYDLEDGRIDVRRLASRKPLFLDESAHDWRHVRLGRELGWNGVALKTCKTQTGAILSACWARAHGMALMVQDLTNPMLAQIPHVLLAAHVGTLRGVETNAMQFYPEASAPEAVVHPGLYRRRDGCVDLRTLSGPGFGYRAEEIQRELPPPVVDEGD